MNLKKGVMGDYEGLKPNRLGGGRLARILEHPAAICLLLGLVTVAVYARAGGFEFLNYDDPDYVVENQWVQAGLTWRGVHWAFATDHTGNWHPVTWLSHMLDTGLFGHGAAGPHVVNVCFHATNTVLLFLLLQQLTGARWRSVFVAGLFALHPLHVESVAWVSERKDVLSTCFGFLSLLCYARYAQSTSRNPKSEIRNPKETRNPKSQLQERVRVHPLSAFRSCSPLHPLSSRDYWLALVFLALGLMSKPMLVTWPFVMLLLDYWPLGRVPSAEWRVTREEGGESLKLQTSNFKLQRREARGGENLKLQTPNSKGTAGGRGGEGRGARGEARKADPTNWQLEIGNWKWLVLEKAPFLLLSLVSSVVTFIVQREAGSVRSLMVLPLSNRLGNALVSYVRYLSKTVWPVDLALPYQHPTSWPLIEVVLAGALLSGLCLAAVWTRSRRPYVWVGWWWFLGMLVPAVGLVQVGIQGMADRYSYVPLVGVFIILAWGAAEGRRELKPLLGGAGVLLLSVCALLTIRQLGYWRDGGALARHTIAVTKGNVTAYANLGNYCLKAGALDEAIANFRYVLRMRLGAAGSPSTLAIAWPSAGLPAEAAAADRKALEWELASPGASPELLNSLGSALARRGRVEEAMESYRAALRIQPDHAMALNNLAFELAARKDYAQALELYTTAVLAKPDEPKSRNGLGDALFRAGRVKEAIVQLQVAVQLLPKDADTRNRLGLALAAAGRAAEAIPQYESALRLDPKMVEAHNNLGSALLSLGRVDEAIPHFLALLQAQPDNAGAHDNLGVALASKGQLDEAISHFREALRLQPSNANTHFNLGNVLASQQQFTQAAAEYQEALRLVPDHAQAHCHLGAVLAQSGRREEAIAQLHEALRLQPDYQDAREQLQALGVQ